MTYIFSMIALNVNQKKTLKVADKIWHLGGNTGNIVWFESVRRSIKYDFMGGCPNLDSETINIVLPMANQIH